MGRLRKTRKGQKLPQGKCLGDSLLRGRDPSSFSSQVAAGQVFPFLYFFLLSLCPKELLLPSATDAQNKPACRSACLASFVHHRAEMLQGG